MCEYVRQAGGKERGRERSGKGGEKGRESRPSEKRLKGKGKKPVERCQE